MDNKRTFLTENIATLASRVTTLHFEKNPDLHEVYGEQGQLRCYEDAIYNLNFLQAAVNMEYPELYGNYISWAVVKLNHRNISDSYIRENIFYIKEAIHELLGEKYSKMVRPYLEQALENLDTKSEVYTSQITEHNPLKSEANKYLSLLLDRKRKLATDHIHSLLEKGISVKSIYQNIFQVTQYEIGLLWQYNKISVANEHFCTSATHIIMSGLNQKLFNENRLGRSMLACCIEGDHHEIGIRMVTDFFEMEGWDTFYLGANLPDQQLIDALEEFKPDVLALSITLPFHVSNASALINRIKGIFGDSIAIIVGGYPFQINPGLWQKMGADGFADSASNAVKIADGLIQKKYQD